MSPRDFEGINIIDLKQHNFSKQNPEKGNENHAKAPSESFSDWNKFKNWEKFKRLNIIVQGQIASIVTMIPQHELKRNILSALARHIDNFNNISLSQVNRIVTFEIKKYSDKKQWYTNKLFRKVFKAKDYMTNKINNTSKDISNSINKDESDTDNGNNRKADESENSASQKGAVNNSEDIKETSASEGSVENGENNDATSESTITEELNEFEKQLKEQLSELNDKQISEIKEWMSTGTKNLGALTLREQFILEKGYKVVNGNIPNLDKDFQNWNTKRLNHINSLFTQEFLWLYADSQQLFKTATTLDNEAVGYDSSKGGTQEIGTTAYDLSRQKLVDKEYSRYTRGELIGEMVSRLNMKSGDNLQLLQIMISSFLKKENIYDDSFINFKWNARTQKFLQDLLKDPEFRKEMNYEKYKTAIEQVLNYYPSLDTSGLDNIFESLTETIRRDEAYWEDPEGYWLKQELEGQRNFSGISNTINWGGDYKTGEQNYINSHSQYLDSQIADFLEIPGWKKGQVLTEEQRSLIEERKKNNWQVIPVKDLEDIYEKFSKDPNIKSKFKSFLQENKLPEIDLNNSTIKNLVIYNNFDSSQYSMVCKFCYEEIWGQYGEEIHGLAGEALNILKDETGSTALNIKDEVLKAFLGDISIQPEMEKDGKFYFRDKNNLDTLYQFNPNTGEIFAQENLSLDSDGAISFEGKESGKPLVSKEATKGYEAIINSIQIGNIIPKKKCKDIEEYKKSILETLKSTITVQNIADIGVVNGGNIGFENDRFTYKNKIVGDMKEFLGITENKIEEKDSQTNYTFFKQLKNTFDFYKDDTTNKNFEMMRNFFSTINTTENNPINSNALEDGFKAMNNESSPETTENDQNKWKIILFKMLTTGNKFNVDVMERVYNDPDFKKNLDAKDYNNVLGVVKKQCEHYENDAWLSKSIAQVHEEFSKEFHDAESDFRLAISIANDSPIA